MNKNNVSNRNRFFKFDFKIADLLLFSVSITLLFLIFGFGKYLFCIPQGIHFWRQTDSLAFTLGYYYFNFDFFSPSILNAEANNCQCASEFPVLYYLTAIVYHITTEHVAALKMLNTGILLLGFYCFYKILKSYYHEQFYALAFTLLYLSSGVLLYYGIGVIPDPPALGLTLIGFYFYHLFSEKYRIRFFWLAILLFSLGTLIRISFSIIPIALFAVTAFSYLLNKTRQVVDRKIIISFLLGLVIFVSAIAAWNLYVISYNETNHCFFFLTKTNAFWQNSNWNVNEVYERISKYWYSFFYYYSTWHVLFALAAAALLLFWKNTLKINAFGLLMLLGSATYALLFYFQFYEHDYYFIALIPVIMIIASLGFANCLALIPRFFKNIIPRIALLVLVILSFNFAAQKLESRYLVGANDYHASSGFKLSNAANILSTLGIPQSARVVVLPAMAPNGALYFLKRQGFTINDTNEYAINKLNFAIDKGTEYCCILDSSYLTNKLLYESLGQQIYSDSNFQLYKFKEKAKN